MTKDMLLTRPANERRADIERVFREHFGRAPEGIAEAPGRVNLIGEHLDYNGGPVLPVAIDRSAIVAFARRDTADVRVYSDEFDQECTLRLGEQVQPGWNGSWSNYVRGTVAALSEAGITGIGVDLAVSGNVPIGAGLSSSAALEVAVAGALREAWQFDMEDDELALLCQRAENEFVGVQCGVMDQLSSALGRQGHALLIDCQSLERKHIPLALENHGVALVVVDSGQRRHLERSDYNRRREECVEAFALVSESVGGRPASLCDVSLDELDRSALPPLLSRRACHVVSECARVVRSVQALRRGDLACVGTLMNESHASLRDDFEVSTPELDRLVELAQKAPGVLGARLTGAGFGGCTVNFVKDDAIDEFEMAVVQLFGRETDLPARMLVCKSSDGLRVYRVAS